jgi:deoxyribodipyrimidine photo-lyase
MTAQRILLWYRNDLRLHDHEPLHESIRLGAEVIPVYCIDPRQFGTTTFGFPKTGAFRTQFLLESLADLRASWRSLGGDLLLRYGEAETVIPELAQSLNITAIYYHQEVTSEETRVEQRLESAAQRLGIETRRFWGATLYHPDDLPMAIAQIPDVFTTFRKAVEKQSTVNSVLPTPNRIPPLSIPLDAGDLPSAAALGCDEPQWDDRAVLRFRGGERAALERLDHYIWRQDCLRHYKETRNGMLGADYSSKFSPWLALGCLSPRQIYAAVQTYEVQRVKNDSTYWLIFELLWRDYFRFIAARWGDRLFYRSGLRQLRIDWKEDWERFHAWCRGETGFPLVDANMRELASTGFMSNRGRQNVASFLTKNLGINWQMGAEWFESLLIDYDVCSNWGNWNYTAGVGNDARGFRYFNILKQSKDYDPQGHYVKHWLPELARVAITKIHEPWKLDAIEQKRCGVTLGVTYPHPIVDFWKSLEANEKVYQRAIERNQSIGLLNP